jgi:hypothetical protein
MTARFIATLLLAAASLSSVSAFPDGAPQCTEGVAVSGEHTERKSIFVAVVVDVYAHTHIQSY